MVLKGIYYGVMLILVVPSLTWSAIASLFMWDVRYWDAACFGVSQVMDFDDDNTKNKF